MRLDKQYMQQMAQGLEPVAVALLRRIYETGKLLFSTVHGEDERALVTLEAKELVVRGDDWFRDPNGQGHEVVVLRITPLGREVLHLLPRQGGA